MLGTVKFFNDAKANGFISPDTGTPDIFIHVEDLKPSGITKLASGERVQFETTPSAKGPRAVNLQIR